MALRRQFEVTPTNIDCLLAEIPTDSESENDDDVEGEVQENPPFVISRSPTPVHSSDDEDNVPLSNLISTNVRIASASASTSAPPSRDQPLPKWGKRFHVSPYGPFNEDTSLPPHMLNIDDPSPINIFKQFWPDSFMEHLCFQTNLYAQQLGKPYEPTTIEEIQTFLGLNLCMGIKKQPSYRDYWSSSEDLHDPFISQFMTVNRFGWLLTHLHVNDSSLLPSRDSPDYDKLYRIRPLIKLLSETFSNNYTPTEKIAIDESMIKFKGRSTLKQYMPKKPTKRGYKMWMMCASTGYVLRFDLYTGKIDRVEVNLGARVVLQFCDKIAHKNHKVYFDNYFNSYYLQLTLKSMGILSCGTVNSTRKGLPSLLEDKQLNRGEQDWKVSDTGISCMKWKDNRSVFMLSNFHDPRDESTVTRREKNGNRTEVKCPVALKDYNSNMNFVDKFDQLKGNYMIDRRSKKWWHRIFFHLFDCSIVNSYIVYNDIRNQRDLPVLTHKDFRRQVYLAMVAEARLPKKRKRTSQSPALISKHKPHVPSEVRLLANQHQPVHMTSRRCAKCSTKANPIRTVWQCSMCKVPLCLRAGKTCFQDFHAN